MKVAVLCAGLFACSSGSGTGPLQDHFDGSLLPPVEAGKRDGTAAGSDDGSSADSSSTVAGDAAAEADVEAAPPMTGCNSVVPAGPQVTETAATGSEPAALGGTIATGTYFLSAVNLYGAPMTGQVVQRTIVIDATTMQFSEVISGSPGASTADTSTSTYMLYGTVVSLGEYCPTNGAADNIFFSAQGNQLTLFVSSTKGEVYTLQPSPEP
jgi:hypothetical protein